MVNVEDILARLHNGDSVEDIAKEMSEVLNAAKEKYEYTKAAEEEEKAKQQQKRIDAQIVANTINEFFDEYYADIVKGELKADELIELCDGIKDMIEGFNLLDYSKEDKAIKKLFAALGL